MNIANGLCCSVVAVAITVAAATPAWTAKHTNSADSTAQLTEAHGEVYKRGFQNWQRELWADPMPATEGDQLTEGMQLGTGHDSWAQLTWPHVTTRAWADSVYAIAPNKRLVYLTGGEMLYHLDKHRPDKNPYYVWTNLLQARIRGTTVLFQSTKNMSRITVLEGTITVLNRKDHSVVELSPGAVYEVQEKVPTMSSSAQSATITTETAANQTHTLTQLTPLAGKPQELFSTRDTVTSICPIDPNAITKHPLLKDFVMPLSSLPLVGKTLSNIVSILNSVTSIDEAANKLLGGAVKIVAVPKTIAYKLTPFATQNIQLPIASIDIFPPDLSPGQMQSDLLQVTSSAILSPARSMQALQFTGGMSATGLSTFSLPAAANTSSITAALPFTAAGASLTQATASVGMVSGLSSTVSSTTGLIGGVVGGATGALPGTVGSVTNGALNLLQNTTQGLLPHFP